MKPIKKIRTNLGSYIPEDVMQQIFKDLPAKSLLRFRCVSKHWCDMIDDPDFIDVHRRRSHHRSGGTTLLVYRRRNRGPEFVMMDCLTGKFVSGPFPFPITMDPYDVDENDFQSVEGLMYLSRQNTIWNPTTRKTIRLPPQNITVELSGKCCPSLEPEFFLGFDDSTKKYKILCICKIDDDENDRPGKVVMQVFTLGTKSKSWREINIPSGYTFDMHIRDSLYVENRIYILIKKSDFRSRFLMVFNVRDETFQILNIPRKIIHSALSLIEVRGRLAVIDPECTSIWMLKDLENLRWKRLKLDPSSWSLNSPNSNSLHSYMDVEPVCSIESGEIVFIARKKKVCWIYYDTKPKTIRRGPKVRDILTKHVETLFSPSAAETLF